MATFSDDFNRADATTLGANWVENVASTDDMRIASNQAGTSVAGTYSAAVWATPCDTDNNASQATIAAYGSAASTGVLARSTNLTAANTLDAYYWRTAPASNAYQLFKVVDSVFTALGSPYSLAETAGDVLRIECLNSTITGYLNGAVVQQVTDTSIQTGKYVGMRINTDTNLVDNWSGEDITFNNKISKFYLHAAATSVSGTLPAANSTVSATTPNKYGVNHSTNRAMDAAKGAVQLNIPLTTNATTTPAQTGFIARFISNPIAAQTISAQTITLQAGWSESNIASDFKPSFVLAVWRPSTGAVVGRIWDLVTMGTEVTATETNQAISGTSTSVTAQDGDVLVLEAWRGLATQTSATGRTNTIFVDGTTDGSATTNAAFLQFSAPIQMYDPNPSTVYEDLNFSPQSITATGLTVTTGAFIPPPNSLVVAVGVVGNSDGVGQVTGTISDSLSGSWTSLAMSNTSGQPCTQIWVQDVGANPVERTVTLTGSGLNGKGVLLSVRAIKKAATVSGQTGAISTQFSSSYTDTITTTAAGSWVYGAVGRNATQVTLTANAATTKAIHSVSDATNGETYGTFRALNATGTPGDLTLGYTNAASPDQEFAMAEILYATGVIDLVVADSRSTQSADNAALTQVHLLTVADSTQAHTADNCSVASVTDLLLADSAAQQSSDTPTLTQVHALVTQDAGHQQMADAPTLEQVHNVTVADSAQAQPVDGVVITQTHNLIISDSRSTQSVDNVVETQVHALTVADTAASQQVDSTTLTQVHVLTVQDSVSASISDTPTIAVIHHLAVDDSVQSQTAGNVGITNNVTLVVADATSAQSSDVPTLTEIPAINLQVADSRGQQSADAPALTQVHTLVVDDSVSQSTSDNAVLQRVHNLAVDVSRSTSATDNLSITQVHVLTVSDGASASTSDSPVLQRIHNLSIDDSISAATADAPSITQIHSLVAQDSRSTASVDFVALEHTHILTVAETSAPHTVDSTTLTQVHTLVVNDSAQVMSVESANLSSGGSLGVNDSAQTMSSDTPALTQIHTLIVQDSRASQIADNAPITKNSSLIVNDSAQLNRADSIVLTQSHNISVNSTTHISTVEEALITMTVTLQVGDARALAIAESMELTQVHNLFVSRSTQPQGSYSTTLSQIHNLYVGSAVQNHNALHTFLTQNHVLEIFNAAHSVGSGEPTLAVYTSSHTWWEWDGVSMNLLELNGMWDGSQILALDYDYVT